MKTTKKQDIRDYCKEHGVWAAKDEDGGNGWRQFVSQPHTWKGRLFSSWRIGNDTWEGMEHLENDDFEFPDVPWDKSLVAPDGSMPLFDSTDNKENTL